MADLLKTAAPLKDIFAKIHYELIRIIAEGGMGTVYEAKQHSVDGFCKRVAIKIIKEEFSDIEEFKKNFIGEAKLVADLIHTNIIQTYHLGFMDGRYYMVMEYVDGFTLEEFIVKHLELKKTIPIEIALFIVSRVCRGLAYAHQKKDDSGQLLGIVHRDVNPKNILLTFQGDVKLTDFGIAKAQNLMYNHEGEVIAGKDEYLSPEQARREVTDPRADLFSCGVILSELVMGRNVFESDTSEKTRHNIETQPTPNFLELDSTIDPALNAILQKSLEKKRNKRYQTALDMLTALEMYLYSDHYGPTAEKLSNYIHEVMHDLPTYPAKVYMN